jgi:ComF family protein
MHIIKHWNFFTIQLNKLLLFLFPPKCLKCNAVTSRNGTLCATCWKKIKFISEPLCKICGFPFEFDVGKDLICTNCIKNKPFFDHAISLFEYNEHSKNLIHKFKYGDKTYFSRYFAEWLYKRIGVNIGSYEYIIPVPLHRTRMRQRFYNQSSLLAKDLGKLAGLKFLPNALIKTRYDVPQTSLPKNQRLKNVKNSFIINQQYKEEIKNSKIILVDDVYTTGSTINECSKILKKHKCYEITALTLARIC